MTNHPIFDISPSALYRPHDNMGSVRQAPLYWLPGFEIAGSLDSLIAVAVVDCILTVGSVYITEFFVTSWFYGI